MSTTERAVARWALAALALSMSACAAITLVDTARRTVMGAYSVDPQIQWSRFPSGDFETWTVDGVYLQALRFSKAVDDGRPIYVPAGADREKLPVFHEHMSANEVMELVADSLAAEGSSRVETRALEPFRFGSTPGFRFALSYVDPAGLEREGIAAGTIRDAELYLILYTGAREHYFDRHRDAVEALLGSIGDPV